MSKPNARMIIKITINDDDTVTTDINGKRVTGMQCDAHGAKGLRKHDADVDAMVSAVNDAIEEEDGGIDDDTAEELLDACNDLGISMLRALTY